MKRIEGTSSWSESTFETLLKRYYRYAELPQPKERQGYMKTIESYYLRGNSTADHDRFAVQALNGYQLAFYAMSRALIEPARKHAVLSGYSLKISWPYNREAADLELFLDGIRTAAEQQGLFASAAVARLSNEFALSISLLTWHEEPFEIPPRTAEGDVLWTLRPPGFAAAGAILLAKQREVLDIDEADREQKIHAFLQAPPIVHAARLMHQESILSEAHSLMGGLAKALEALSAGFAIKMVNPLPAEGNLKRLALLCSEDCASWIFSHADPQLLWRTRHEDMRRLRSLLWNRLEIELIEIGSIENYSANQLRFMQPGEKK